MYHTTLTPTIKTDVAGYQHLIDIYEGVLGQGDKKVTLHFDSCRHFDANLSAVLGALLDDLLARGYELWLSAPQCAEVRNCLSRNNFFSAFNPDYAREDTENFIEYRRFRPDESGDFKAYIDSGLMRKQRFPAHTKRAGRMIQESILEIFVNAVSHGECDYVYSCGEYDGSKTPPVLDMTIVDRGHSIPSRVNDFMKRHSWQILSHCQAIRWALMDGNTTKNIPGGLGLSILMDFLKMNRGSMQIVSGSGMVEYRSGILRDFELPEAFDGTIVNMEFNFDDDNNYRLADEHLDLSNLL